MLYNKMVITLLAAGCSCVFVANDAEFAYCISAAHCVKAETDVTSYDGKRFGVRWIYVDPKHDLAVGKAFKSSLPPLEPTIAAGQPGEAEVIGYPDRVASVRRADLEPNGPETDGAEKQLLRLAPPIVGGTSGGGVFQDGALVGIVTHTDCRGGRCTTTKDLHQAAVTGGVDLNPTTLNQRDGLIAALAAAAMNWWNKRQKPVTPSTP